MTKVLAGITTSVDGHVAGPDDGPGKGLGDAPWPPHFPKQKGEPKRVQPSRDRDRKGVG